MKRTLHKALSLLLTAAMVLNMGLTSVFAEGTAIGASGLTECHTENDKDCGYSETIAVTPCAHTCEVCKSVDSGEPQEKVCTCEPALGESDIGHGKDCPLYVAPECTCRPPVDSGEPVHGKDCPLYAAPELSEAVQSLIAMVDALPNAADITEENREATKAAFDAAAMAYEALSDEDKAVFEATEQYTKLMALTARMTKNGATPVVLECICPRGGGSRIHIDNCPLYGLEFQVSNARMADAATEGVTVEKTADYTWNIFANGNPIIIVKGSEGMANPDYSEIYIDANENGEVDEGEEPVTLTGVHKAPGYGYFLTNSKIYGGSKTADVTGDTSVTLNGGVVWQICGGNHTSGTVTGDTHVTINDGTTRYAYGGGAGYAGGENANFVMGSTHVALNGGKVVNNL